MNLVENKYGHGARPSSFLRRKLHKLSRNKIGRAGIPFDWTKGYDIRDIVGPIKIKNQGSSSSCSGQAASYFLEIQRKLQHTKEGDISAKSIYSPIAYKGGGTTVQALIQQIGTAGANLESSVPSYYLTGEPLSEAMFIEKTWMTTQNLKEAYVRTGYVPYDIQENIEEIAQTVRDHGVVIWMIAGQDNGTWRTANPKPPAKGERWYHFMAVIGAKMINGKKNLIVLNSWGEDVGDKGIQYFTQDYFDAKGIIDAFTLIYHTNITPLDTNRSIWAEILRLFKRTLFS